MAHQNRVQTLSDTWTRVPACLPCSALLFLSATSIAIPTSSAHLIVDPDSHDTWVLNISRWTAILMVIW
jgi:hypothetical protein